MQSEQVDAAEKALAKEFSEYLASVSREVVAPISANITRHQADVEKMLTKVADARSSVESEFGRQRDYLNTVREQIDAIIKESELKIARLHSSSQALLDSSRQRIVSELTAVADQAGQTARKMGEENERTSGAIDDHHKALRRLTDENRDATANILEGAKVALNQTFEAHRTRLNEEAGELLRRFDAIALDVKQTTERLWSVHDETRTRLFADFSSFMDSVRSQIETIHETLRSDISNQIDRKSADVVNQVGAGITGQYSEQFAALTTEIRGALGRINESSRTQGELINGAIVKAVADITNSTVESQAGAVGQLQRELANVKKLMGVIVVVVAAIVSAGLFLRF
jgi:hypothetical protein